MRLGAADAVGVGARSAGSAEDTCSVVTGGEGSETVAATGIADDVGNEEASCTVSVVAAPLAFGPSMVVPVCGCMEASGGSGATGRDESDSSCCVAVCNCCT